MTRKLCSLVAAVLILPFFSDGIASARGRHRRGVCRGGPQRAYPLRVEDYLPWLPPDTETLIVTNGPLKLTDYTLRNERFALREGLERLPMNKIFFGDVLRPRELLGQTVSLAVEGSRHFRRPRDIGELSYQGCEIIIFEESATKALSAAMHSLLNRANQRIDVGGTRVARFREQREQDTWTFYFACPRPNVLLCATDEGYLKELLDRIDKRSNSRALPPDLPEWKHVDMASRVWGIRHYSRTEPTKDPTSPFQDQAEANSPDPDAVGFTFSYDPCNPSMRLRYLTHAKDAMAIGGNDWSASEDALASKFRLVDTGVVEISIALEKDEGAGVFMLLLLARLGHAVFI